MLISVNIDRHDDSWRFRFELGGQHTVTARTWRVAYDQTTQNIAELSGLLDPKSVYLNLTFTDIELHRAYRELRETRRAAHHAHTDLERALRAASRRFTEVSSTRDAGAILGYSHQHIAQVAK